MSRTQKALANKVDEAIMLCSVDDLNAARQKLQDMINSLNEQSGEKVPAAAAVDVSASSSESEVTITAEAQALELDDSQRKSRGSFTHYSMGHRAYCSRGLEECERSNRLMDAWMSSLPRCAEGIGG